jgi:hypothetical protein
VGVQIPDEGRQQGPVLGVDRANAAEGFIMPRHLLEPGRGHVLARHAVLQERHYVVGPLGTAERDDE